MVVCLFSQDDDFSSILKRLSDTDCVILTGDISVIEKIPENADIIVSSDNKDALKKLSSEKMNVITCGGAKDTIGYSSNSDDEIVVSVQREILSLSGKKYEPFEIPLIKLSGETEYSAMAYVGIMTKIKNPLD